MGKLSYDKLCMQTLHQQGLDAKAISKYPDKGWKLSTVNSLQLSRPHWLSGSAQTRQWETCAVCRCKTIFPLVGPTKL